ncbi:MAG TPA: M6 family metalloprotease domain-containing protein [candidate division Zixibacteria bacterium]|nr:M6 family metalloprotease domain-containing protein [candidate division Zixibacteria bacterium]
MTGKFVRLFSISLGLIFFFSSFVIAIPADPNFSFEITQPDGKNVTLKPAGDERFGYYQTLDGYTVIKSSDGWYYYASLDSQGALVTTATKVYSPKDRPKASIQFLDTQTTQIKPSTQNRLYPDVKLQPELLTQSALAATDTVTNNVLVILIEFSDYSGIYDSSDFDNLMNQPGYDVYGSAHDYYEECSYGQFNLQGDIDGWYKTENEHFLYGYNDGNNWAAAAVLAREAIEMATIYSDIDFSKYDNNGDGEVDGLFIVHAGPGAETGASDFPWSHKWSLSDAGLSPITADGVTIDAYTMEPEIHSGVDIAHIGVFVHEYGHALGLPDLYDTDGSSNGIGMWGVMAGGSWGGAGKSPVHFSGWSKAQLGWTNPINITTDTTGIILPDASTSPISYRLWTDGMPSSQYFLVENRGKTNFDAFLPGCGVAIWHIDDAVNGNSNEAHRKVDLEEGDNSENNSSGDVWINKIFGVSTVPNSSDYLGDSTSVRVVVHSTTC